MKKPTFSSPVYPMAALLLMVGLSSCDRVNKLLQGEKESTATEQVTEAVNEPEPPVLADLSDHPGKLLHDANCISCHDSTLYTRKERRITDFAMLQTQVERCNANLSAGFSAAELQQVTAYLNQAYYHFAH